MNDGGLIELLNSVLGLSLGESRVLREEHLPDATVHRYRDGWTDPWLGFFFREPEDMADFLAGTLEHAERFAVRGERL